jgi:putative colanic acid biosynthesis acetyltransferase WcaF
MEPRVISLRKAPGEGTKWGRPRIVVYAWVLVEWLVLTNSLQPSSRARRTALRLFGASVGEGVIFRPRTRVKYPWNLEIGDDCWIGEGVWIHNQDKVTIGHDVAISQETFITTGSHDYKRDMALVTRPITIKDGVWIASRCTVLGGSTIEKSALISTGVVVSGLVPSSRVWAPSSNPLYEDKNRFPPDALGAYESR